MPTSRTDAPINLADRNVMRLRQLEALKAAIGAWKDADHPELRWGASVYIRKLRREGERRIESND